MWENDVQEMERRREPVSALRHLLHAIEKPRHLSDPGSLAHRICVLEGVAFPQAEECNLALDRGNAEAPVFGQQHVGRDDADVSQQPRAALDEVRRPLAHAPRGEARDLLGYVGHVRRGDEANQVLGVAD